MPAGYVALTVTASGGKGGHSGTNIEEGRSNAIKVVARALRETLEKTAFPSRSPWTAARAGTPSRAMPPPSASWRRLRQTAFGEAVQAASDLIADAFKNTDPDVHLAVEAADTAGRCLDRTKPPGPCST